MHKALLYNRDLKELMPQQVFSLYRKLNVKKFKLIQIAKQKTFLSKMGNVFDHLLCLFSLFFNSVGLFSCLKWGISCLRCCLEVKYLCVLIYFIIFISHFTVLFDLYVLLEFLFYVSKMIGLM